MEVEVDWVDDDDDDNPDDDDPDDDNVEEADARMDTNGQSGLFVVFLHGCENIQFAYLCF